jgi:type IX secretion system PorP/SprF family membrane protein
MYYWNTYQYQPAYVGAENRLSATGVFRKQWVGLTGSPVSQAANVHLPWEYARGGIGLKFENDQLGAERNTQAAITYAYRLKLGKGNLSMGIEAGVLQKTIDGTILRPVNQDITDPNIPTGKQSAFAPQLGVGIYYENKNLKISGSLTQYSIGSLRYKIPSSTDIAIWRNYYASVQYRIPITESFGISPSVFLKSDIVQLQTDFSIIFDLENNIFLVPSLRGYSPQTIDAFHLAAGYRFNQWFLGYGYDFGISPLRSAHQGSHEITLNYRLKNKIGGAKPQKIINNPRF